jgi:signal transduction histidine kinase
MPKFLTGARLRQLRGLLEETAPSPRDMALRLQAVERDIILPVKAVVIGILFYNLYFSRWFDELFLDESVAQSLIERFFLIYLVLNVAVAFLLIAAPRLPLILVQRVIFTASFVDGLFLAAMTFVTGGFDSVLYWLFLGLIMRNAVSCPLAVPQLILNISVSLCYLLAGVLDVTIAKEQLDFDEYPRGTPSDPAEPFLLRLIVLWLLTLCCYGLQLLFERHRRADEEARESAARQQQLRAAGRLAAQIAHQIKNPLGIINNAAFSLRRALQEGKDGGGQQHVEIIREEVERADRIITKLMGYAQLAEGQVERLRVEDAVDTAVLQVFPPGVYPAVVKTRYAAHLPPLLMQRGHLLEILVNLLTNAREATNGKGHINVEVSEGPDQSVTVVVSDDGPGIPSDKIERIFQPYYSTREKGTGLGLAIVRHNAEMYGGGVWAESELGKGARFVVKLPTRTFMKLQA